ncbi:uncharacterized protein LOC129726711 [Wyeomyia smithii]|uniref:uncharacterized protein LOC129726711 n=1 Tax=Wyeomyia smithii TaxID=174621 RepID=UPI0024681B39|nr:uncharacterized protein LOC129726711 [Wyeomyia smithii]XP_055539700.1 uncharacterized protein LOC129726711 [Wyeomyia smithii]XP_055539701.1 uncharacterized protein LOC129726711 [Wyeomyia smithii]XP_055539702.1 uncharacterized protein LOC129726711 [Wyeomyia smithii]
MKKSLILVVPGLPPKIPFLRNIVLTKILTGSGTTYLTHCSLGAFRKNWSINYNISQQALKPLLHKLISYDRTLPEDPKRFLRTPRTVANVIDIQGGQYWHQGLENCLRLAFPELAESLKISININIDGLPLYKNGTSQVWSILFNIHENTSMRPMIIGIFYGKGKPKKVEEFLAPFVTELTHVMTTGLQINGFKMTVHLRAFICDSPARAFVKGVVNFNSLHGRLKCCTIGQHSTLLRTNIFPQTLATRRTDAAFRTGQYDGHYNFYKTRENGKLSKTRIVSPLLELPIDIIEDVIVADSLYLLHLGITKRLILAYKDGHNVCDESRWPNSVIEKICTSLKSIELPSEIHHQVRGVDCINHWKASECASFLHYIGIVLLKHFISKEHFQNFAIFVCAVTICSSSYYARYLPVAQKLFEEFIGNFYGLFKSITSNVHNLVHVVDEVTRFGPLSTISSYPFENHLFQIKKLVRSGRLPLQQIINRITEKYQSTPVVSKIDDIFPSLKHPLKTDATKFSCIVISREFTLTQQFSDKWFLTKDTKIAAMKYADSDGIYGSEIAEFTNLFDYPLVSSCINVFVGTNEYKFGELKHYTLDKIFCKLVAITVYEETAFIPLLHTLPSNEMF